RAPLGGRSQLRRAGHRRQLRVRHGARQVPVEGACDLGALGRRIAGGLRRGAPLAVIWLAVPALASAAYWLLVIVAALRWRRPPASAPATASLPVSILKPVHGRDPHFYEAIRSHALQDYPQYEILFGIGRANDPAAPASAPPDTPDEAGPRHHPTPPPAARPTRPRHAPLTHPPPPPPNPPP